MFSTVPEHWYYTTLLRDSHGLHCTAHAHLDKQYPDFLLKTTHSTSKPQHDVEKV